MAPPIRSAARFGIAYRPATEDDLPLLAEIYISTRREEVAQTGWPAEQQEAFLRHQHAAQHDHYAKAYKDAERLVIERGGEGIGRLYLFEGAEEMRIVDIALLPDARGAGIGEAILRDVCEDVAGRGRIVTIHVEKFNPAQRLYQRLGFVAIEEKGVYDLMAWRPPDGGAL
ncbi:MAG TPA: GNAT family N-acetyltransferase [Allosphingosinicella sp.]|nr:GNAT family N-acetyltransferase [Allosphingosinicella sp.]